MKSETDKLISKHGQLNQSDNMKVVSHVQREEDDWVRNTVMLEGIDVPFIYRRKKAIPKPKRGAGQYHLLPTGRRGGRD